jgi:hypothetical protein
VKFSLLFDNSGDVLPFEVKYNHELFEFFVETVISKEQNSFSNDQVLYRELDSKITHLHWAISNTNEIIYELIGNSFNQHADLENYLDQRFLNQLHSDWAFSHYHDIDVDQLRFSQNMRQSKIGNKLHELLSDDIRVIRTQSAIEKLGRGYAFHELNMAIHRLERSFTRLEFKADEKWQVFENPFLDTMVTNNDKVNFSFGYTYVGRQYYNKFRYFDTKLECPDNYNYENLELAFQVSLEQPETIPFSTEALAWARANNIKMVAEQIPIANLVDLTNNLFEYRKILYRNSKHNNNARIILN